MKMFELAEIGIIVLIVLFMPRAIKNIWRMSIVDNEVK